MSIDDIDKHLALLADAGTAVFRVRQALESAASVRRELAAMKVELDREKLQRDSLTERVRALWAHANATPVTAVHKRMHEERELRRKVERDNEALRKELADARRGLAKAAGAENYHHINDVMAAAREAGVSRPAQQRLFAELRGRR